VSPLDFVGKTVLVVGGSSGIGNGIAHAFRNAGARVYVWGTRPAANDYAGEPGSDLTGLHYARVDLAAPDEVMEHIPPFDRLDVLVLSQGIVLYKRAEFEIKSFRQVIEINLNSLMACAGKFEPMLAESKGSLIIVSSTAAFHATKGNPAYNASKTGAYGLTKTLGQAWAPRGIRVNGIAPGFVATKLTRNMTENAARSADALAAIPLGRYGTADEMGQVALFLASPMASYVVGQTLIVDGGLRL
jgi:3-oxoacyl-[acyl-carrier protein] reductase